MEIFRVDTLLEQNCKLAARADCFRAENKELLHTRSLLLERLALYRVVLATVAQLFEGQARKVREQAPQALGLSPSQFQRIQRIPTLLASLLQSESSLDKSSIQTLEQDIPLLPLLQGFTGQFPATEDSLAVRALQIQQQFVARLKEHEQTINLLRMRLRKFGQYQGRFLQMKEQFGCVCGGYRLPLAADSRQKPTEISLTESLNQLLLPDEAQQQLKMEINRLTKQNNKLKKSSAMAVVQAKATSNDIYRSEAYRSLVEQASELLVERVNLENQLQSSRRSLQQFQKMRIAEVTQLHKQIARLRNGLSVSAQNGYQIELQSKLTRVLNDWRVIFTEFKLLSYEAPAQPPQQRAEEKPADKHKDARRVVKQDELTASNQLLRAAIQQLLELAKSHPAIEQAAEEVSRQFVLQRTVCERREKGLVKDLDRERRLSSGLDQELRFLGEKLSEQRVRCVELSNTIKKAEQEIERTVRQNITLTVAFETLQAEHSALRAAAKTEGEVQRELAQAFAVLAQLRKELATLRDRGQSLHHELASKERLWMEDGQREAGEREATRKDREMSGILEQKLNEAIELQGKREAEFAEQERKCNRLRAQVGGLQKQVGEYRGLLKCACCKEREKSHALVRCGHVLCGECAEEVVGARRRECPECGGRVDRADIRRVRLR